MIYFTADTHFDRECMLYTAKRPFKNIEDMNDKLIENFSSVLKESDDLYIIGDFIHKNVKKDRAEYFFNSIKCKKHLIIGNHDNDAVQSLKWDSINSYLELSVGGKFCVLFHYPMITWNRASKPNTIHLFGHVHNNWVGSNKALNVGVDTCRFKPITIKEVESRLIKNEPPIYWDKVEPHLK
jgi:calcineurin-like phosphoesterase family protein